MLLLVWCFAGEVLSQSPKMYAVKYVIMLKHRKYPIDEKVLIAAEVGVVVDVVHVDLRHFSLYFWSLLIRENWEP